MKLIVSLLIIFPICVAFRASGYDILADIFLCFWGGAFVLAGATAMDRRESRKRSEIDDTPTWMD